VFSLDRRTSLKGAQIEMCGIAGAIDLKGRRRFPLDRLYAMTTAIAHRGPDDEEVHFEPEAVARARHEQATRPMITIKRSFFDLALTGTIATQLWHHIYCGGGLADLPTSSPPEISAEHLSAAAHATEEGEPA
jgi:hypothetical protein